MASETEFEHCVVKLGGGGKIVIFVCGYNILQEIRHENTHTYTYIYIHHPIGIGWLVFYGMLTLVGYLITNLVYLDIYMIVCWKLLFSNELLGLKDWSFTISCRLVLYRRHLLGGESILFIDAVRVAELVFTLYSLSLACVCVIYSK